MKSRHLISVIAFAALACSYSEARAWPDFSGLISDEVEALMLCIDVQEKLLTWNECPAGASCIRLDATLSADGANCSMAATSDFGAADVRSASFSGLSDEGRSRFWLGTAEIIIADNTNVSGHISRASFNALNEYDTLRILIIYNADVGGSELKTVYFTDVRGQTSDEGVAGDDTADTDEPAGETASEEAGGAISTDETPGNTPLSPAPPDPTRPFGVAVPNDTPPEPFPRPPSNSEFLDDGSCSLLVGTEGSFGGLLLSIMFALTLLPIAIRRK